MDCLMLRRRERERERVPGVTRVTAVVVRSTDGQDCQGKPGPAATAAALAVTGTGQHQQHHHLLKEKSLLKPHISFISHTGTCSVSLAMNQIFFKLKDFYFLVTFVLSISLIMSRERYFFIEGSGLHSYTDFSKLIMIQQLL